MAADSDNALGTLSAALTGTLGALVALIEELGKTGAVDRERLLGNIKDVLTQGDGEAQAPAEAKMNEMMLAVFTKTLEKPNE